MVDSEPTRGVLLVSRPSEAMKFGGSLAGRRVTLVLGSRANLDAFQKWWVDSADEDVFVVGDGDVALLRLVLGSEASDEAAAAEFQLQPTPEEPWESSVAPAARGSVTRMTGRQPLRPYTR